MIIGYKIGDRKYCPECVRVMAPDAVMLHDQFRCCRCWQMFPTPTLLEASETVLEVAKMPMQSWADLLRTLGDALAGLKRAVDAEVEDSVEEAGRRG